MDKEQLPEELPLTGYNDRDKNKIKFIDYLSDEQLQEINKILNWNCFVIDSKGRRFGDRASEKKTQHSPTDSRSENRIDERKIRSIR